VAVGSSMSLCICQVSLQRTAAAAAATAAAEDSLVLG
jgi:hypothetical protein